MGAGARDGRERQFIRACPVDNTKVVGCILSESAILISACAWDIGPSFVYWRSRHIRHVGVH
jgi:hypothetical protein